MTFKTKYDFGEILYLKTDPEQVEYMLIGILLQPGGFMLRISNCGNFIDVHEMEVSKVKDKLKTLGVNDTEESD